MIVVIVFRSKASGKGLDQDGEKVWVNRCLVGMDGIHALPRSVQEGSCIERQSLKVFVVFTGVRLGSGG